MAIINKSTNNILSLCLFRAASSAYGGSQARGQKNILHMTSEDIEQEAKTIEDESKVDRFKSDDGMEEEF